MPTITFDVGGANEMSLPCQRAGKATKRRVGNKSYAFRGDERSHIRCELMVIPLLLVNAAPSACAILEAMFARRAQIDCAGDVFNNGGTTVRCSGDYTDDMQQGGSGRRLPGITLYEVSNPGGIGGGGGGGGAGSGAGTGGGIGGVPAGVSPDDPVATGGVILHYDAQAIVGLLDGDALNLWADQSGNGNDASPGNPAFPPVYRSTVMNGHPGIAFPALGNNQRGIGASIDVTDYLDPATQAAEAFIVMRAEIGAGGAFWMYGPGTAGPDLPYLSTGTLYDGFGTNTRRSITPIGIDPTEPFVYHVRAMEGQWEARINGVIRHSSSANSTNYNGQVLGMWLAGGSFYTPFFGYIGEFIFHAPWQPIGDALDQTAALMSKWDIS